MVELRKRRLDVEPEQETAVATRRREHVRESVADSDLNTNRDLVNHMSEVSGDLVSAPEKALTEISATLALLLANLDKHFPGNEPKLIPEVQAQFRIWKADIVNPLMEVLRALETQAKKIKNKTWREHVERLAYHGLRLIEEKVAGIELPQQNMEQERLLLAEEERTLNLLQQEVRQLHALVVNLTGIVSGFRRGIFGTKGKLIMEAIEHLLQPQNESAQSNIQRHTATQEAPRTFAALAQERGNIRATMPFVRQEHEELGAIKEHLQNTLLRVKGAVQKYRPGWMGGNSEAIIREVQNIVANQPAVGILTKVRPGKV